MSKPVKGLLWRIVTDMISAPGKAKDLSTRSNLATLILANPNSVRPPNLFSQLEISLKVSA